MPTLRVIVKALAMTVYNQVLDNLGVFVEAPLKRGIVKATNFEPQTRLISASLLAERGKDGIITGGLVPETAYAKYAIPKGLPKQGKRSLAIENEPHQIDDFNGVIEAGYGKGTKTLISKESVIVKVEDRTYIAKMNYHFHEADVAGPHYDIVIEGISPRTRQFEINIPRGEGKGRYAFTTTDKGMIIVPMKDRGIAVPKPNYILKREEFFEKIRENPDAWRIERKADGSVGNASVNGGRVYFRSHRDGGETYYDKLPGIEFISNDSRLWIWRKLSPDPGLTGTLFQGELIHEDGVSRTSGILNAMPALAQKTQKVRGNVKYYVWDIVKYKGRDVSKLPYSQRRALYESAVDDIRMFNKNWDVMEAKPDNMDPETYYNQVIQDPLPWGEGIVIKRSDAPRGDNFYKMKDFDYTDVVILSFVEGQGKYKGSLGALVVEDPKTGHIGEVGTGFSDYERQWIWDHQDNLDRAYVKIEMMEKTNESFRAARFKEFHESKGSTEAGLLMYSESLAGMDEQQATRIKHALINSKG